MINSTVMTNAEQIAKHFNESFTSIAGKINLKIFKAKTTRFSFQGQANHYSFSLTPVTAEGITDILATINENKGNGPNSILKSILKLCKKTLSTFSKLFEFIFFQENFSRPP